MVRKRWPRVLFALGVWCMAALCAAEPGVRWDKAPIDPTNQASLQNGARAFAQYCLACHATAALRYDRLQDIGFSPQQISQELLPAGKTLDDTVGNPPPLEQNPQQWPGSVPPDLGLVARATGGQGGSGADYVYTYLRSFYRDPGTRSGWNNTAAPHTTMPHVLWHLQGQRQPLAQRPEMATARQGQQITPGKQSPTEFDQTVGDITNYLHWVADPGQRSRKTIGAWVIAYLCVFALAAWRLQRAYWKDVE